MKASKHKAWMEYGNIRIWLTFIAAIICFGISVAVLVIELGRF